MKQFIFIFAVLLSWHIQLFAETTTVTNTGNVTVRAEYKGDKGDYQSTVLKPGESTELPGGMEKVKLSRETPGTWAQGTKSGEEIKVDVKTDDKTTTLNGYGDKLIFDHPTEALQTQVAAQTPVQMAQQPVTVPETKLVDKSTEGLQVKGEYKIDDNFDFKGKYKPADPDSGEPPQPAGTVKNTSQPSIVVVFKDSDGKVINSSPIQGGGTVKIPDGTDTMEFSENMIQSGYMWPHLERDPQVSIHHQNGKTETIKDIPPGYKHKPKSVEAQHTDYFKGAAPQFQYNPFKDNLKLDYKVGSKYNYNSNDSSQLNQSSSRNMDSNFTSDIQTQTRYKF